MANKRERLTKYMVITNESDNLAIVKVNNIFVCGETIYHSFREDFKIAVTWDKETYDWCLANGLKKSKHIIIKEALSALTGMHLWQMYRFQTALKLFGVDYKSELIHDTDKHILYLAELFKNIYEHFLFDERQTYYGKFYRNLRTNIIHSEKCFYTKRTKAENLAYAERTHLLTKGGTACKYCLLKGYFSRHKKWQGNNADGLEDFCKEYKLKYKIQNDVADIRTRYGTWKIYYQNNQVQSVFHGDYNDNKMRIDYMYHRENELAKKTLHRIIRYIAHHDGKWRGRRQK